MLKQISPLLQVRDLAASVSFYGQKLGFRTGSTEGGFAAVRRDDCLIYLAQKTKDADVTNKAARAVDDGWCNYDLHNGFANGPVTRSYGIRDFSVIDPDGYDIVFGEECDVA